MFPSPASVFVERGKNRIGSRYKKAVYREYTDDTFTVRKERKANQQHLGMIGKFGVSPHRLCAETAGEDTGSLPSAGPIIRAEVGEQIVITFKNKASRPYSISAHGVKASGAHIPVRPGGNPVLMR